nr:hypothetical protein [Acinetobacter nosocomialis]
MLLPKASVLLLLEVLNASSWPLFTASVAAVPAPTLVTFSPLASSPFAVNFPANTGASAS